MKKTYTGIVYCIKCILNNKVYIGITTGSLRGRWNKHVYDAKCRSPYVFHRAIRKYGLENFSISEIEKCSSAVELIEKERFYIATFNSHVSLGGYNMSFGGGAPMLNRRHSERTKKLLSRRLRGRISPNKGNRYTEEVRKKLSDNHNKAVVQLDLEGNIIAVHKSIITAALAIDGAGTNISKVCRGKKKTAGGFIWKYMEN
jgi:group I intron endonuclease